MKPKAIGAVKVLFTETGLPHIEPTETVAQQAHPMSTIGIMDVRQNVPFVILVGSLTIITVHVPKHVALCACGDSIASIIDTEQLEKERRHSPFHEKERPKLPDISKDGRFSVSIAPEYAAFHTKFVNMLEQFQEIGLVTLNISI